MHSNTTGKITAQGWILEYLKRDKDGITGNLGKVCKEADGGLFFDHKVKNEFKGWWSSWWNGETEGNWYEAYCRLAFSLDDSAMLEEIKSYVYKLAEYQEEDGYIGIYQKGERFTCGKRCGELWAQSRAMNIMLCYIQNTGDDFIRDSLIRLSRCIIKQYGPERSFYSIPDEDGSKGHSLMVVEPLLSVYEMTGDKKVLEFCEFMYEDYSAYPMSFPADDLQLSKVMNPDIPFVGHGPHVCEMLRIPVLLYKNTGKTIYLDAFRAGMAKLKKNLSLSGSCKSDELVGAYQLDIPETDRVGNNLCECIPLPSLGYEYCSTTELMFTYTAAFKTLKDKELLDLEEWMIYNAAMAARQQDGKAIQYLCADNLYAATKKVGDRWDYSPTHTDAAVCCAPNSCKVMPFHLSSMYLQNGNEITVAFYGPSTFETFVNDCPVTIRQLTSYPFENSVKLAIDASAPFELKLRIPDWCDEMQLVHKGKQQDITAVNGFATIFHDYRGETEIELQFNTQIKLKEAPDKSLAFQYGPLLYSLKIDEQANQYYAYPLEGFYDTDYLPAENQHWDYTILKDDTARFSPSVKATGAEGFEWENPTTVIEVTMLNGLAQPEKKILMPIGSTILRRTTFPIVDKRQGK